MDIDKEKQVVITVLAKPTKLKQFLGLAESKMWSDYHDFRVIDIRFEDKPPEANK